PSEGKLKELRRLYPQLDLSHPDHCETCIMAKQKQLPYRTTTDRASAPLELIHTDICESKCVAFDGSRSFVLFVDDFSKYTEVFVLKGKSSNEVLEAFTDFRVRMEKQLESSDKHVIKKVRSDNGGEFLGAFVAYLDLNGIKHELSVAYCHQQNGTAERTIGTIVGKTRCMMYESCMPDRYWPLAVKTAAFLYNLSPHSALNELSPLKTLFPAEK